MITIKTIKTTSKNLFKNIINIILDICINVSDNLNNFQQSKILIINKIGYENYLYSKRSINLFILNYWFFPNKAIKNIPYAINIYILASISNNNQYKNLLQEISNNNYNIIDYMKSKNILDNVLIEELEYNFFS